MAAVCHHTHFVFHVVLLSFVQVDLDEPAAVHFHSDPLAHDLAGEHQVLQDGVMDRCQGTAEGGIKDKQINTQRTKHTI